MIQIQLQQLEHSLAAIEKELNTLKQEQKYKVIFVCEEIITNLSRHADFEKREPDVTLSYKHLKQYDLQLTFTDNSKEFNILQYPDPEMSSDIESRSLGGLGIYLTKKYAKHIDYRYNNGYNILKVLL